ncbi:hypothetical protein MMC11_004269 [Xylographa trunciseda]|nr:hypothetical protein [Xylographa trunciseda]
MAESQQQESDQHELATSPFRQAGSKSQTDQPKESSASTPVSSNSHQGELEEVEPEFSTTPPRSGWRFWLAFVSMCVMVFAAALDATIITTSLPSITADIGGQQQYVWIASSWAVASTAVQPLTAQVSNIFGRRIPMIVSAALFVLGSAIAGASTNVAMLIAGRTIQGLGSGGIQMLTDLITCDLIPMRERGKYLGLIGSTATISTMIGPVIGGALAQRNWRWVFYINIPIAGVTLVVMLFFLRLKYKREQTWGAALARVDYIGSFVFVTSIIAVLFGLISGGTIYPWSSWRVILPLVFGFVGWACFHVHQASRFCKEPTMPPRLFQNRTSVASLLLAFLSALLLEWIVYFLPLYFQAVKGTSAIESGVDMLPFNAFFFPFAIVAGGLMSKYGFYRPLHAASFAFVALGCGLFSILDAGSNKAMWVFFELFAAIGMGFGVTTILPAIQASLPESDAATATGTYAFLRNFGFIWGITIPSIIFNNRINSSLGQINDVSVQAQLANGAAYGYANNGYVSTLTGMLQSQVVRVYSDALKTVWYGAVAFALLGLLLVFIEKHVELRTELETEFGIEEKKKTKKNDEFKDLEKSMENTEVGIDQGVLEAALEKTMPSVVSRL